MATHILTFDKDITTINSGAFANQTKLTSISFPDGITLENNAFQGCINLESVNIPANVTIQGRPFNGCVKLINAPEAVPTHEYVDLGIVLNNKKILFATKNVGADTIYDYGNYYAWGEIETKSNYSWDTYKWGTEYALTKYNDTDQKVTLDPEDDIVHVAMGGQWRSPTGAEQEALLHQTTNAWVTDYNGSGINGRVFTGTNGNTMFVPAAGCRNGTSFELVGSDARWWSSSLYYVGSGNGRDLGFYSSKCNMSIHYRCYGFSARGVFTEDV